MQALTPAQISVLDSSQLAESNPMSLSAKQSVLHDAERSTSPAFAAQVAYCSNCPLQSVWDWTPTSEHKTKMEKEVTRNMLYTLRGDEIFYEKLFMCVLFQTYLAQAPYDRNIVRQSRLKINGWCMSRVECWLLLVPLIPECSYALVDTEANAAFIFGTRVNSYSEYW